ncbi:MAG: hypothetical protein FJ245_01555 [Nitrospira sp.]|nr:hypothetical protein [Nitrospira sp.]
MRMGSFAKGQPNEPLLTGSSAESASAGDPVAAARTWAERMLCGLCLAGSVGAWATSGHLASYLWTLSASKLANPPKHDLLIVSFVLVSLAGLLLALASWRVWKPQAPQRTIAACWSPGWSGLWSLVIGGFLLINYPVPAQAHHLDKFMLGLLVVIAWSGWFLASPQGLARALNRRPVRWLDVALVNLLVFLLVGEVTVRLADPLLARSGLFGDKHTSANLKPHIPVRGTIGFSNSQGFRDRERQVKRPGAAPRVLALGDSFTWGAGVSYDEAFVTLLERGLQADAPEAEVINLGVPAWGPHEELHLLKTYGVRLQPDLVVLNFFIGNDIQNKRGDDLHLPRILIVAGQSYYVHSNGNWLHDTVGLDRWYLYHDLNYLFRVGGARVRQALTWTGEQTSSEALLGETAPLVSREQYVRGIYERSDIYLADNTRFFAQHWARTQETLLAFRDFLGERGIPLLLVIIPDHVQLDRALQMEYLAGIGQAAGRHDFYKPHRLLLAWCREQGIPTVDLLPAFEAAGSPETLYFSNDFHLTASGHRLAAQVIDPVLKAQLGALGNLKESNRP